MSGLKPAAAVVLLMASLAVIASPVDVQASGKGRGGEHRGSIIAKQEVHRSGGHFGNVQPEGFKFNDIPRELFDDHGLDDGFHRHGADDQGFDDRGSGRGRSR